MFLSVVASSDAMVSSRPVDNPTCDELLDYIVKKEIQVTARSGSYSGLWFVAIP